MDYVHCQKKQEKHDPFLVSHEWNVSKNALEMSLSKRSEKGPKA